MKVIVENTIGKTKYIFEVEEPKFIDSLMSASFVGHHFERCGLCSSDDIHLDGRKAQGYTFINVICKNCRARRALGQYKDGGHFWKDWEKYQPKQQDGGNKTDTSEKEDY